jgi:hypothetical protein
MVASPLPHSTLSAAPIPRAVGPPWTQVAPARPGGQARLRRLVLQRRRGVFAPAVTATDGPARSRTRRGVTACKTRDRLQRVAVPGHAGASARPRGPA